MKTINTIIIASLCFGLTALAKEEMPTQGTMRIMPKAGEEKEQAVDLPLKHTEVQAEISGFVTRVKVIQTFSNPYSNAIEAVYVFPLPQNAAVSDMQIRIGDRLIKGLIKKREEARQIYEEAKKAGKTSALLEQERPNIFSQSVANIMPGHDIRVEITFDDVLKYEKGSYEFVFPMVVGPRFIPGEPVGRQAGGWSPDTDQVPDASRITPPVLKPGERNGHDIQVTVKLHTGIPIHNLSSPSHEIVMDPLPDNGVVEGNCTITLADHDTIPNKDFVLRYDVAGQQPQIGVLTHRGELGGYFQLMFQPPESPEPADVTPKEMVFVMDTSGSMSGEPIALSKKAVRYALENLNSNDTFQIIRFSEVASPFSKEPLLATRENIRRGLSYINGLAGEGGTMMIEGIKAALDYPYWEKRLRIVCFMTDGYIGNEGEILHAVEEKLGDNARLFSFGVGSSVNRYLLEQMAEVGRGDVQYILPNEKPTEAVKKFYERVRNPVLTNIRVDWDNLAVKELYPARIRDLFAGQPMLVLGRYDRAGTATVKVHGKIGGKDVTYEIPVKLPRSEPENSALAPLWARARIKELMAEQYGGSNPDVVAAVTELALKYRLMSEYTSFVAVEEKVVNEGGEVKTIQVPVEMPEGVSYEGVFGPDHAADNLAMAPAAGAGSQMLVMKGLFAGRSASGRASKVAAAPISAAMVMEEIEEPVGPVPPMKPFSIEWKTVVDGSERVVQVTASGEVWISRINPANHAVIERVLERRLRQSEIRRLWAWLCKAGEEKIDRLTADQEGSLNFRILKEDGSVEREIVVKLATEKGASSESWKKILDYVGDLGR